MNETPGPAGIPPPPARAVPETAWWRMEVDAVFAQLHAAPSGLRAEEARARLERFGPNRIGAAASRQAWPILVHQFESPLIYILLAAMAVSLAIARWEDAIVIGFVLALNAVIGFVQEYRAENAIAGRVTALTPSRSVSRCSSR